MFKKKYTKWMPLGNYQYSGADYIVFARKNTLNGLMQFKVVKLQAWRYISNTILPYTLIDVQKAWNELINQ